MNNEKYYRDYLQGLDKESIIELYLQVKWEHDVAMAQLEEHSIPFCGIASDVVQVIRCGECKRFFNLFKEDQSGFCMYLDKWRNVDCYCENGERKEE